MTFQLTEEEYVRAQLGYWTRVRSPNRIRILMAIAVLNLMISVCILVIPWFEDKSIAWVFLAVGAFLLVDRYWLAPYRLRRLFRRSPNARSVRRVVITDEGMEIVMPNSSDNLKWAAFQKAHELDAEFLLMYAPNAFVIMPKRVFDEGGLVQFRSMLAKNGLV